MNEFALGDTITVFRRLTETGQVYVLGVTRLCRDGWRFTPNVSSRGSSRKGHPTWEASFPRWVGYPNRCETTRRNEDPRP